MPAIDLSTAPAADRAHSSVVRRPNLLAALARAWAALRRRQDERAAVVRIARLDPRLIRDMGFDPEAIYAALDGTWNEVSPEHLRLPADEPRVDRARRTVGTGWRG